MHASWTRIIISDAARGPKAILLVLPQTSKSLISPILQMKIS